MLHTVPFLGLLLAWPLGDTPAQGQDHTLAAQVDAIMAEWSRADSPGCAVGVVRDGELVLAKGYGQADLERGVPISPASVFDIASTSKQFTAAVVVLLAQEGKLSLDDDVRRFVPELPRYEGADHASATCCTTRAGCATTRTSWRSRAGRWRTGRQRSRRWP